jgi:outer membrane protein TolC
MRHGIRVCGLLAAVFAAAPAWADDLDLAKQAAATADDDVRRLTALRGKGLASDMEVKTAEFQATVAKAVVARLNYDDKEEDLRGAAVASADAILKRVEEFHKKGLTAIDDVDVWRKQAAAARIELAAIRGEQKVVVAQTQILVDVEERRLTRVQRLFDRGAVARGELDAQKKAVADAKRRLRQAGGGEL